MLHAQFARSISCAASRLWKFLKKNIQYKSFNKGSQVILWSLGKLFSANPMLSHIPMKAQQTSNNTINTLLKSSYVWDTELINFYREDWGALCFSPFLVNWVTTLSVNTSRYYDTFSCLRRQKFRHFRLYCRCGEWLWIEYMVHIFLQFLSCIGLCRFWVYHW